MTSLQMFLFTLIFTITTASTHDYVETTGVCHQQDGSYVGIGDYEMTLDQCRSWCDAVPRCTGFHYSNLKGPQHSTWSHRCMPFEASRACNQQEQEAPVKRYRDAKLDCCLDMSCPNNQYLGGAVGASKYNWICMNTWNTKQSPTDYPTMQPTNEPTFKPSLIPTIEPTLEPSLSPTSEPTLEPSLSPTSEPTLETTDSPLVVPTGLIGITTVSSGEYLFGSNSLLKYDNIEFGGLSDMTVIWDMKTSNGFNTPQHGQQLNIFWYGDYVSCGWGFIIRRHQDDNANIQDMYTVGGAGNAYASTRAFYDTVLPSNFDWSAYHTYRVVKEGAKITAYIDNYVFDLGNSMQTTVSTCPEKMKFGMWPARPGNGLDGATVKNVQFMYSAEYPCPALKCTIHCDTGYVTDANGCETCECQPQVYVQSTGICAPHHAPGTGLPVDLPLDLDQCKSMCDNHPSCTSFHYAHLSGPHHQWSHRCILKSTSRGCTAQEQQDAEQYYRDLGLGCCLDKSCPNNQVVGGAVGYNYQHGWICYDTYMKAQFLPTRRQLTGRLLSESNSV